MSSLITPTTTLTALYTLLALLNSALLSSANPLHEEASLFLRIRAPTPNPIPKGGGGGSKSKSSSSKSKSKSSTHLSTIAIIIIAVVVIVLIIAALVLIWCCVRRARARRSKGGKHGFAGHKQGDDELVGHDMTAYGGAAPGFGGSGGKDGPSFLGQGRQFGGAYEPMGAPQQQSGVVHGEAQAYYAPPPGPPPAMQGHNPAYGH